MKPFLLFAAGLALWQPVSAQVFSYDTPPGQITQRDGALYFTPKGQPVHATGDIPGKPFSVALPQAIPPGKYAMLVQVGWPDPNGGTPSTRR